MKTWLIAALFGLGCAAAYIGVLALVTWR